MSGWFGKHLDPDANGISAVGGNNKGGGSRALRIADCTKSPSGEKVCLATTTF